MSSKQWLLLLLRWGSILLLVAGFTGVITAPAARWYAWFYPPHSPLQWYGIQGTLGQGQAALLDWNGWSWIDMRWRCSIWGLLKGQLACMQTAQQQQQVSEVHWRLDAWDRTLTVEKSKLVLPAAQWPLHWGPPWLSALQLDGVLFITLSALQVNQQAIPRHCLGQWEWSAAAIVQPTPLRLGNLTGQCKTTATGIHLVFQNDDSGQLGIQGQAQIDAQGRYQANGQFIPRETTAPWVTLLTTAGLPFKNDRFEWQFQGVLGVGQQ